jgi:hypothetical protein
MKPEHRARFLELAAARGEKGLSNVVSDALDLYLKAQENRDRNVVEALATKGSLGETEADALVDRTQRIRSDWR